MWPNAGMRCTSCARAQADVVLGNNLNDVRNLCSNQLAILQTTIATCPSQIGNALSLRRR